MAFRSYIRKNYDKRAFINPKIDMLVILMIERTLGKYWEYLILNYYENLNYLIQKGTKNNNLEENELETVYALGYNQFTVGNYELAKELFKLLTLNASDSNPYWRALGAVNQQMKKYEEAIAAYDMAIKYDPNDIISHLYRSESKILNRQKKSALEDLVKLLNKPGMDPSSNIWIKRAKLIVEVHHKKERKDQWKQ